MMQLKLIYTTKVSHLTRRFESEIFWNSEMVSGIVTEHASVSYWPNLVPRSPTCKQGEIWVRDYYWPSFSLSLVTVPDVIATKKRLVPLK